MMGVFIIWKLKEDDEKLSMHCFFIAVDTRANLKAVPRSKQSPVENGAFLFYVLLGVILWSIRLVVTKTQASSGYSIYLWMRIIVLHVVIGWYVDLKLILEGNF